MSPSRDSSDPTCNPEISGRRETSLQRRVSYAITRHFLQTRAMRQISRCDRYEKMLRSTLSGNFSIVCKGKQFNHMTWQKILLVIHRWKGERGTYQERNCSVSLLYRKRGTYQQRKSVCHYYTEREHLLSPWYYAISKTCVVFWFSLVGGYQHFRGPYCLHLQSRNHNPNHHCHEKLKPHKPRSASPQPYSEPDPSGPYFINLFPRMNFKLYWLHITAYMQPSWPSITVAYC
jgi:hypothetical protein